MSITNKLSFLFAYAKTSIKELNLFNNGSQDEQIIKNERRSTRVYLILLIASMIILIFYYSTTYITTTVVIETPSFNQYSTLVHHSSLQCLCSTSAVKY